MRVQENCSVVRQDRLCGDIYSLWLKTETIAAQAKPGQFVALYTQDRSRLLPRPISLCEIDAPSRLIRLVYRVTGPDTGTREFSTLKAGDSLRIMGPLGNGFPVEAAAGRQVLLVGGGIGIPPLLEAGRRLKQRPVFVLGYRDQLFLKEDFEKAGTVFISTEDGHAGIKGTVMDVIRRQQLKGEQIFACGPRPMLAAISGWAAEREIPCLVSMEERMACGVGACLGCMCRTRAEDPHFHTAMARVCTEGPVFDSREVVL